MAHFEAKLTKTKTSLLKRPRNCFSKKHISGPDFFFFLKPSLFSRLNGLCGTFQDKIVSDENFARFCLKRHRNSLSEKHVSGLNFVMKPGLFHSLLPKTLPKSFFCKTNFRFNGFTKLPLSPFFKKKQTMRWVSRRKLRSLLPKMPLKSFFRKTHFRSEFCYETTPSPLFWAKRTMLLVSW